MTKKIFFLILCSLSITAQNLREQVKQAEHLQKRMQSIMQSIQEEIPDIDQILAQKSTPQALEPTEINQENIDNFVATAKMLTLQMTQINQKENNDTLIAIQEFYQLPQQLKTILHQTDPERYEIESKQFEQHIIHILQVVQHEIVSNYIYTVAQTLLNTILIKLAEPMQTINDLLMIPLLITSYENIKNIFIDYPTETETLMKQVLHNLTTLTHNQHPAIKHIHKSDKEVIEKIDTIHMDIKKKYLSCCPNRSL